MLLSSVVGGDISMTLSTRSISVVVAVVLPSSSSYSSWVSPFSLAVHRIRCVTSMDGVAWKSLNQCDPFEFLSLLSFSLLLSLVTLPRNRDDGTYAVAISVQSPTSSSFILRLLWKLFSSLRFDDAATIVSRRSISLTNRIASDGRRINTFSPLPLFLLDEVVSLCDSATRSSRAALTTWS